MQTLAGWFGRMGCRKGRELIPRSHPGGKGEDPMGRVRRGPWAGCREHTHVMRTHGVNGPGYSCTGWGSSHLLESHGKVQIIIAIITTTTENSNFLLPL